MQRIRKAPGHRKPLRTVIRVRRTTIRVTDRPTLICAIISISITVDILQIN